MNEHFIARVDKNVSSSLLLLREYAGQDISIYISVILYLSYKQQTSIILEGTFDLDEFCRLFKFHKKNLLAKNPNAKQLQRLMKDPKAYNERLKALEVNPYDPKNHIFDSVIGNILYILTSERIESPRKTKYYNRNGYEMVAMDFTHITIVDIISVRYIKSPKGQMTLAYDYKLDVNFINNMNLFYSEINYSVFASLRKPNLDELYLYLRDLNTSLKANNPPSNTTIVDFNLLCSVANINRISPSQSKRWLDIKFKKLNVLSDYIYNLTWEKAQGQKYYYLPRITIIEKANIVIDENKSKKDSVVIIFCQEIVNYIKCDFSQVFIDNQNATKWIIRYLKNPKFEDNKIKAYVSAQVRVFGRLNQGYTDVKERVELMLEIKNESDLRKCLLTKEIFKLDKKLKRSVLKNITEL